MIRIIIENLLLIALPTVLYLTYMYLTTRGATTGRKAILDDAPLIWLFLVGVGLALAVILVFGSIEGGSPGQGYTPTEFRDGKVVPGRIENERKPGDG